MLASSSYLVQAYCTPADHNTAGCGLTIVETQAQSLCQNLDTEEVRKAKLLYIRNAIPEYNAMNVSFKTFGYAQIMFANIPIFWPMLYLQRRMMNAQRRALRGSNSEGPGGLEGRPVWREI